MRRLLAIMLASVCAVLVVAPAALAEDPIIGGDGFDQTENTVAPTTTVAADPSSPTDSSHQSFPAPGPIGVVAVSVVLIAVAAMTLVGKHVRGDRTSPSEDGAGDPPTESNAAPVVGERQHPSVGEADRWIDQVLRILQAESESKPLDARLLIVRAGPLGVELLWDRDPHRTPPGGAAADAAGRCWRLDPAQEQPYELSSTAHGLPHALVTLGQDDGGHVLINLAAAESLRLDGEPSAVISWLRSAATELRSRRWGSTAACAPAATVTIPARLTTRHVEVDGDATFVAAVEPDAEQLEPPTYLLEISDTHVCFSDPASDLRLGARRASPDFELSGPSGAPDVPGNSHADDDSTDPSLAPEPPAGSGALVDSAESRRATAAPMEPERAETVSASPLSAEPNGPRLLVRVLGRPEVVGWQTEPKGTRPAAILTYLAVARPQIVSRGRLIDALWNGQSIQDRALYNHLAAIRKHSGDPEIITVRRSSYELNDEVGLDWQQFREIVAAAAEMDGPEERSQLRVALELVRGAVFEGAERSHEWAFNEGVVSTIERTVIDVSSALAAKCIDAGDFAGAVWSAERGLLACRWCVSLYGFVIEAHAARGDSAGVESAWREARRVAGGEPVPSEVREQYEHARLRMSVG